MEISEIKNNFDCFRGGGSGGSGEGARDFIIERERERERETEIERPRRQVSFNENYIFNNWLLEKGKPWFCYWDWNDLPVCCSRDFSIGNNIHDKW